MTLVWILLKNNTCFKADGLCIDLKLTNRKYCCENTSSFETSVSDYHHLIYSILKETLEKGKSKKVTYRSYKYFQWETLEKVLINSLRNYNQEHENYEQNFVEVLNTHAPQKVKILRGNHKPHYNKNLRKAIVKRSRLKNKANSSKDPVDIANNKKQSNLVVSLSQLPKVQDLSRILASRTFQINRLTDIVKIMLIEKDEML